VVVGEGGWAGPHVANQNVAAPRGSLDDVAQAVRDRAAEASVDTVDHAVDDHGFHYALHPDTGEVLAMWHYAPGRGGIRQPTLVLDDAFPHSGLLTAYIRSTTADDRVSLMQQALKHADFMPSHLPLFIGVATVHHRDLTELTARDFLYAIWVALSTNRNPAGILKAAITREIRQHAQRRDGAGADGANWLTHVFANPKHKLNSAVAVGQLVGRLEESYRREQRKHPDHQQMKARLDIVLRELVTCR
jgi:hypothetical protein